MLGVEFGNYGEAAHYGDGVGGEVGGDEVGHGDLEIGGTSGGVRGRSICLCLGGVNNFVEGIAELMGWEETDF